MDPMANGHFLLSTIAVPSVKPTFREYDFPFVRAFSQIKRLMFAGNYDWSRYNILPFLMKNQFLAGGFNPFEKYQSNWIISRSRGKNKQYLKPHLVISLQAKFPNTSVSCCC